MPIPSREGAGLAIVVFGGKEDRSNGDVDEQEPVFASVCLVANPGSGPDSFCHQRALASALINHHP